MKFELIIDRIFNQETINQITLKPKFFLECFNLYLCVFRQLPLQYVFMHECRGSGAVGVAAKFGDRGQSTCLERRLYTHALLQLPRQFFLGGLQRSPTSLYHGCLSGCSDTLMHIDDSVMYHFLCYYSCCCGYF